MNSTAISNNQDAIVHDTLIKSLRECVENYASNMTALSLLDNESIENENQKLINMFKKANPTLTANLIVGGVEEAKEALINKTKSYFQDNRDGQLTASEAYALSIKEVLDGAYWDKYIRYKKEVDYV